MALSDVLSAVRQLVLGQVVLPEDPVARREKIERCFPRLSEREVVSLGRLEPRRIAIYTGTIIHGEVQIISRHFPVTFALVARRWGEVFGAEFDSFRLMKEVQVVHPWRGYTTDALCLSFRHYLAELDALLRVEPALLEMARLEHVTLQVARAPEMLGETPAFLRLADLRELTIHELLKRRGTLYGGCRLEEFQFDVVEYRREYYRRGENLPEYSPKSAKNWAISSRTRTQAVRWFGLSEPVFCFFKEHRMRGSFSILELAEVFISGVPSGLAEVDQFQRFFELIRGLDELDALRFLPEILPSEASPGGM